MKFVNLRLIQIVSIFSLVGCSGDVGFEKIAEDSSPQGSGSFKSFTEVFYQDSEEPMLDILVIVDNSPSMRAEQERLGKRMQSFTGQLRDVDWQIAVTNTDISDSIHSLKGALLSFNNSNKKLLTKSDPNYNQLFLDAVVMEEAADCIGGCPSTTEEPLAALSLAIRKSTSENKDLFRSKADFAVIVISDEDEKSNGPEDATKPTEVLSLMESLYPNKTFTVNGVIIEPGDTDCKDLQGVDGKYGTHVAEFAGLTNGITTSICAPDYGAGLAAIGQGARRLLNSVKLTNMPAVESVSVAFSPYHKTKFTVVGKTVIFDVPPKKGTQIQVSYDIQN